MIFEKIKVENFLSYEKQQIKLESGLYLISGWNKDKGTFNGCISGDTLININRGNAGKKRTIEHLYNLTNGKLPHFNRFDNSIKTYVRSFDGKQIKLHGVDQFVYSGIKELYFLELDNGRSIKATKDHRIMTRRGFVSIENLKNEDDVMCDTINPSKSLTKSKKIVDKIVGWLKFHPFAKNKIMKIEIHRAIYEAHVNNLSLDSFLDIVRKDEKASKKLQYVDVNKYIIYHKDGDHFNNDISNLQCVSRSEHGSIHKIQKNFNQGVPKYSQVKKIIHCGSDHTYDIICEDPHHNFVANGIVIHNSGKSCIVDAICYALTGQIPRKISADSIINWKVGKKCLVELNIKDGKTKYRIVRGRKPNVLEFFQGTRKVTGRSVIETQELIDVHFGINYDMFMHSVYFAQNSQVQFITANDNAKKDLLTDLLDLDLFDRIHDKMKEKIKLRSNDVGQLGSRIEQKKTRKEMLDQKVLECKEGSEKFEVDRKKINDNFEADKKQRVSDNDKAHKDNRAKVELLQKIKVEKNNELNRLQSNLSLIQGEQEFERSNATKYKHGRDNLMKMLMDIEQRHATERLGYQNNISLLVAQIDTKTQQIRTKLDDIRRVEKIGEGICHHCFQVISKEILSTQIVKGQTECYQETLIVQGLKEKNKEVETQLNMLITNSHKETEELKGKIRDYDVKIVDADRMTKEVGDRISSVRVEIGQFSSEVKYGDKEIFRINEQLSNSKQILIDELNTINARINQNTHRENDYDKLAKSARGDILCISNDILEDEKKIKEINDEQQYDEFLKEAFGNRGVKSYVFEQVVNEINVKANENLAYLFDTDILIEFHVKDTKNKNGDYNHKFETKILLEGDSKEFGSFSGGEKRRMILAVDLAISRIIQNRSSRNINLLVFDEYFEGLDRIGKEKVMELLQDIEGSTVLIVDHNTEFQNLFDHVIQVEKENGISKIVGVT